MSALMSRREVEDKILVLLESNPSFRKSFLENPKKAMKEELQIPVPEDINVQVHEETLNTLHFVIPSLEVSDSELEAISGGSGCADCADLSY